MTRGPTSSGTSQSLEIGRAILRGGGTRRGLHAALARSALDGLGLEAEETLLVPQLRMCQPLERNSSNLGFSRGFARSLREMLDRAERDPQGPTPAGMPLRFSTRARLAAWLVGNGTVARQYLPALGGTGEGMAAQLPWLRQGVMTDGPSMAHFALALLENGQLAGWLDSLEDTDLGEGERRIRQTYGIEASWTVAHSVPSGSTSSTVQSARLTQAEKLLAKRLTEDLRTHAFDRRRLGFAATLVRCAALPQASRKISLKHFIDRVAYSMAQAHDPAKVAEDHAPTSSKSDPPATLKTRRTAPNRRPVENTVHGKAAARAQRPQTKASADRPIRSQDQEAGKLPRFGAQPDWDQPLPASLPAEFETLCPCEDRFDSPYCGLLFLLNPLLSLGFCSDFAMIGSRGYDLAPFDLIDRLGLHWFGQQFRASALHRWFKDHATGQENLGSFTHPRAAELTGLFRTYRSAGHATLWHGDSYPVADRIDRGSGTLRELNAIAKNRTSRAVRAPQSRRLPARSGRRWIACLALVIEDELARRAHAYDLSPWDLAQHGQVRTVDEKLIVTMDLSELPFAVRYAGLDRNPGWIVKEGRSLAFEFK